jgi:2-hydroxy-3-oxopropionate reductase
MGLPMARNLLAAGHVVSVWNRSPGRYAELSDTPAQTVERPADLADCEVVFINVSDDAAVESVLFDSGGLVEGIVPQTVGGLVVVDMGTTSPTCTRACAERLGRHGMALLDAPVSGGEAGARAGSLSIMAGGDPEVFQHVLPLLQLLGKNIVHVGTSGAGQIAKACNQIVVSATLVGVAESFHFAQRQGFDPSKVREALLGGSAYSKILEIHGQRMLDSNYQPGFRVKLHKKDLDIVQAEAAALGLKLTSIAEAAAMLSALVETGAGELDSSALFTAVKAN